ncbi:MAG TPA: hypothetical protein VFK52_08965 [Nocardioidaceae bacterium]|nr:hypothetical protein [Nocardioidaceae bacterium]
MSNDPVDPEDLRHVVVWALSRIGAAAMTGAVVLPIAALVTAAQGADGVAVLGVSLFFSFLAFGLVCVTGRPPYTRQQRSLLRELRADGD